MSKQLQFSLLKCLFHACNIFLTLISMNVYLRMQTIAVCFLKMLILTDWLKRKRPSHCVCPQRFPSAFLFALPVPPGAPLTDRCIDRRPPPGSLNTHCSTQRSTSEQWIVVMQQQHQRERMRSEVCKQHGRLHTHRLKALSFFKQSVSNLVLCTKNYP